MPKTDPARRAWAWLQPLEARRRRPRRPSGCGPLFWTVVCAVIWALAVSAYLWWHTEPIQKIFPHLHG